MCGIFGMVYRSSAQKVHDDLVIAATNTMAHRGPDDWGIYVDGHVGLGHRRLSIIDLASGHQPMQNEDGSITVVYNGEIYNHLETREQLVARGHRFRTHSDTEVILHAYEEWGVEAVQRFNGMFAFLLWDSPRRTLWVVRDRLGIKPLYYVATEIAWIYASEIKPILKTGLLKAELNERALDAYFTVGYVPGPETMFKNIFKVMPGHYQFVRNGEVSVRSYWDFNNLDPSDVPLERAVDEVGELLLDSVKKRLMSDVPLGVFLSGGLDSSAVTALMAEAVSDPVKTFTVGYAAHPSVSEEEFARLVADRFHTDHHVFHLKSDDFFASLSALVHFSEEPIVEPAGIALFHLARLAKEKATVLLSGEGSDEIFGGYRLYAQMLRMAMCQKIMPAVIYPLFKTLSRSVSNFKYSKVLDWMSEPLEQRFKGTSAHLTGTVKNKIYGSDFLCHRGTYLEDCFAHYFEKVQQRDDLLARILYVDTKTWLVDNLLVKADKMTMAAGVELRVPFLDYRLVEALWTLPQQLKVANGEGKILLKKIMRAYLPASIVDRTKMGFPLPTTDWFRMDLSGKISDLCDGFSERGWFKPGIVKGLITQHKDGVQDHSRILMTFLVLEEWIRQYISGIS